MIKLYPEQLYVHLKKCLGESYLLFGNDSFLLQESYDAIRQSATIHGFKEHYTFQIENTTDWKEMFSLCQEMHLFSERQTLQILLPEKDPNNVFINKQLEILVSLLHKDLVLVVQGNQIKKTQEDAIWFRKLLAHRSVLVMCNTPEQNRLLRWLFDKARKNGIEIDKDACQLLCDSYEGNLMALTQALERLLIVYPDKKLTLYRIKNAVHSSTHLTIFHWKESLFLSKRDRSLRILQQLHLDGCHPGLLVRTLKRELLLVLLLKRQKTKESLSVLFDKHHIWKNRRHIMTEALNRLSWYQLYQSIQILTRIELMIKQDHERSIWFEFKSLSLLLS